MKDDTPPGACEDEGETTGNGEWAMGNGEWGMGKQWRGKRFQGQGARDEGVFAILLWKSRSRYWPNGLRLRAVRLFP